MKELKYNLEKDRMVEKINEQEAELVVLHLPDGLKPRAKELQQKIHSETDAQTMIWGGTNFGACDLPVDVNRAGADLIIHFGHSAWLS